jgi:IS5 family transposase
MRKLDTLLKGEAVIDAVARGLEARGPQSSHRSRPGTLAEIVIRMLILKHLFDWSHDDLKHEVRVTLLAWCTRFTYEAKVLDVMPGASRRG